VLPGLALASSRRASRADPPPHPPGVLQIEAMAQLGGIAMLDPSDTAAKNQFFFGGIEGCRFRKPVVPGDTLVRGSLVTPCAVRDATADHAPRIPHTTNPTHQPLYNTPNTSSNQPVCLSSIFHHPR
jgi:hypothetical protein